jgi:diguanylate cyclase (GGDEF)-like protein
MLPCVALAVTTEPALETAMSLWPATGIELVSAVFIGVLVALALHSLLTYFFIGDRVRIAHALLALSLITAHLLLIGGIEPPGWLDGSANSTELALGSGIALVGLFASIFTRDFFDTESKAPSYERLLRMTAVLFALSLVAIWILPPPYGTHAAWLTMLLFAALAISCGIGCLQLQVAGAGLFLTACVAVLIGQALASAVSHGAWHFIGAVSAEAGLVIAALLLSVAMARRTDVARGARAVRLAAELETAKQSLTAAYDAETTLTRRLEERALELDAANARLIERTQKLERLAHRDPLTQLPNRLLFEDRTTHSIIRALRHKARIAFILVDIEAFRKINEAHGRATGDELLVLLAHRLHARLRAGDTVARIGGDEFAVLLEDVFEYDDLERVMNGIADELALPFVLGDKQITIEASMGYAFYPEDGDDTASLLKSADRRMLKVKQARAKADTTSTGTRLT